MDFTHAIRKLLEVIRKLGVDKYGNQKMFAHDAGINETHFSELLQHNPANFRIGTFLKLCWCLRTAPWTIMQQALGDSYDFEKQKKKE